MAGKISKEQQEIVNKKMFEALTNHDNKLFQLCLQKGADVHAKDPNGCTPFMLAVKRCMMGWIPLLLKNNPNLFEKDKNGKTVFDYAAAFTDNAKREMEDMLLKALPDGEPNTSNDPAAPKNDFNAAALPKDTPVPTPLAKNPPKKGGGAMEL